jgi:hypothetical protein
MGQLIIDHPQGFDTIFSHEEGSPAFPYVKRHQAPQSIEDLYELGLIPRSVPSEAIHEARAVGQSANSRYLRVTDQAVFSATPRTQRAVVEARLNGQARDTMVRATANHLVRTLRIDDAEALLLASKAHSINPAHATVSPDKKPFVYSLQLQDDLVVKSRLIVTASISIIRAKSVLIHRTGEMRMLGSYLLLQCDSIYGPGLWEYLSDRVSQINNPRFAA